MLERLAPRSRYLAEARIAAMISQRVDSGRFGHAASTSARFASSAPDSAPPFDESCVFPDNSGCGSTSLGLPATPEAPVEAAGPCQSKSIRVWFS